jgi:ppGpp synthetase/RelA/SpoT-type nucleotidyltranferase
MLSSRLDSEGQSESKSQSGSAQVPSASPNDDLAELLKSTLKALSESTDKDAFSLEAVLSREIEGQCEQALKREGFSVDVAKSWRAALAELIEDLDPNDHDDSFSLPRVVQEIVQYLKTSAPELEAKYDGSRTGYWQTALSNFLESYKEHGGIRSSRSYEALSKVVEAKCQFILKPKSDLDQNAIIHQVSSRTKTFKSLSKKAKKATDTLARTVIFDCDKLFPEEVTDDLPEGLPDEWPEEQAVKWAKNLLVENIRDLAGIRILVYFPDDVPKVVKAIMGDSGLKIKEGTVSFTKSRIDHRKKDQEALKTFQKDGGDLASMLNYSDGAFFSEPVSLNNVAQRWKHSGYRAVHLHVEVTDEVGEQWDATRHNLMRNDPQLRTTAEIEGRGNATGNAEESATDNDEEEVLDEAATESAEESATDSDEEEVLDEAATDSAEESATDSDDEEVPDEAATDSAEESATDSDEEEVPNEPNKRGESRNMYM